MGDTMKKILILALLFMGCDYAPTEHTHDEHSAAHSHDYSYEHTHDENSDTTHTHDYTYEHTHDYSDLNHNHDEYSDVNHTHEDEEIQTVCVTDEHRYTASGVYLDHRFRCYDLPLQECLEIAGVILQYDINCEEFCSSFGDEADNPISCLVMANYE
jgi:hypothetical protein